MKTLALLARLAQHRLDEKRAGLLEVGEQLKRVEAHINYLNAYLAQETQVVETDPSLQNQFSFFKRNIHERCFFLQNNQAILQTRFQSIQEEIRALFQEKKSYEFILHKQEKEKQLRFLKEEQKIIDEVAANQFSLGQKTGKGRESLF